MPYVYHNLPLYHVTTLPCTTLPLLYHAAFGHPIAVKALRVFRYEFTTLSTTKPRANFTTQYFTMLPLYHLPLYHNLPRDHVKLEVSLTTPQEMNALVAHFRPWPSVRR